MSEEHTKDLSRSGSNYGSEHSVFDKFLKRRSTTHQQALFAAATEDDYEDDKTLKKMFRTVSARKKEKDPPKPVDETAKDPSRGNSLKIDDMKKPEEIQESVVKSRQNSKKSVSQALSSVEFKGSEIIENAWTKALFYKWIVLSAIANVLLAVVLSKMATTGLVVNFWGSLFRQTTGVLIQIWMNLSHVLTLYSINEATAVFMGYLVSRKRGFSLAVCGYCHSNFLEKIFFSSKLSYRSESRPILQKHSYFLIIHTILIFLSVFSSANVISQTLRVDFGILSCNIFTQVDAPFDRKYPTMETAMGVGEFVFGSSLGVMRSENNVDYTLFIQPPQLTDTATNSQQLVGPGFTTDILTTCQCSASMNNTDLIASGIPSGVVSRMTDAINALQGEFGFANHFYQNTTAVTACGGRNQSVSPATVCKTVFTNHRNAEILVGIMTDGTPASIAVKFVEVRKSGDPADLSWVYVSFINLFGSDVSSYTLPQLYPNAVNPLLWWASNSLQSISETMFSILLRGAIQRSYSIAPYNCLQNVPDENSVILEMGMLGSAIGIIFVVGQLFCLLVCVLFSCIRFALDKTFFYQMVSSSFTGDILRSMPPSGPSGEVWRKMDVRIRIGERIETIEDPEIGIIGMDKPRMITTFIRGKRYI
ncbi:hypothetical protein EDD86DRAFT_244071 [Gorgonomyces haynaldii]|nr:hypothetical protein EDD86DRAFT_244071 [Gorgonomyces haynaldii]